MELIVKRGSVKVPNRKGLHPELLRQGQVVPEGMFPMADVQRLIEQGVFGEASAPAAPSAPAKSLGKWRKDPATLAGKSLDELRIMVLEVDERYDLTEDLDEAALVRLLSKDWDPRVRQDTAVAKDRTRPARPKIISAKTLAAGDGRE